MADKPSKRRLRPYADPSRPDRKTQMLLSEAHDIDWGAVVRIQDHAKAAGILSVTHKLPAANMADGVTRPATFRRTA